jgi:hypothetical protein
VLLRPDWESRARGEKKGPRSAGALFRVSIRDRARELQARWLVVSRCRLSLRHLLDRDGLDFCRVFRVGHQRQHDVVELLACAFRSMRRLVTTSDGCPSTGRPNSRAKSLRSQRRPSDASCPASAPPAHRRAAASCGGSGPRSPTSPAGLKRSTMGWLCAMGE